MLKHQLMMSTMYLAEIELKERQSSELEQSHGITQDQAQFNLNRYEHLDSFYLMHT